MTLFHKCNKNLLSCESQPPQFQNGILLHCVVNLYSISPNQWLWLSLPTGEGMITKSHALDFVQFCGFVLSLFYFAWVFSLFVCFFNIKPYVRNIHQTKLAKCVSTPQKIHVSFFFISFWINTMMCLTLTTNWQKFRFVWSLK